MEPVTITVAAAVGVGVAVFSTLGGYFGGRSATKALLDDHRKEAGVEALAIVKTAKEDAMKAMVTAKAEAMLTVEVATEEAINKLSNERIFPILKKAQDDVLAATNTALAAAGSATAAAADAAIATNNLKTNLEEQRRRLEEARQFSEAAQVAVGKLITFKDEVDATLLQIRERDAVTEEAQRQAKRVVDDASKANVVADGVIKEVGDMKVDLGKELAKARKAVKKVEELVNKVVDQASAAVEDEELVGAGSS